jgi:hypothetical protein
MNIEQANAISIAKILETMGIQPTRQTNHEVWYLSPLRNEKTASFKIHVKRNVWYDFGEGIGGDVVSLVCNYLGSQKQSHSVSDALKWIENNIGRESGFKRIDADEEIDNDRSSKLSITSVRPVKRRVLIDYLESRGIPITVADRILREVRVHNAATDKNFFALGLRNEESGYELRNLNFKGCIGTKSISFLRGNQPKPDGINLFEGFMDYLSVLTQNEGRPFKDDTIILNSLSCLRHAIPYIKGYGYKVAFTWMDNDQPGKKAAKILDEFFKTEEGLRHKPMNHLYRPFKDVNAWHMQTLGL